MLVPTVAVVVLGVALGACGGGGAVGNPNQTVASAGRPGGSDPSGGTLASSGTAVGAPEQTQSFGSQIVETPEGATDLPTTIAGYSPYEPGKTVVAELLAGEQALDVFDSATAATAARTLPRDGPHPLVLVTLGGTPDRLLVQLPIRPNGSQGWIDRTKVKLGSHEYRIIVALSAHKLIAKKGVDTVLDTSIGVGKGQTPTPDGVYYITELLQPPKADSVYGTYAYGLSGFSEVLKKFGGGDGQVGIHGTNDPSSIGKDVSSGCIRLNNADIEKLVKILPLGTPVEVQA